MISEERLYKVLLAPRVTEKSVSLAEGSNQYVFKVATDASKDEIKTAIEQLFDVVVDGVKTLNVKGKKKNFGRRAGQRSDWKKAYVRLAEGQSLEATEAAAG